MTQRDLFGAPKCDSEQSQWMTPSWLARRVAKWVAPHARVLEPSCGSGNLLEALLHNGQAPANVLGVERDLRWQDHAWQRFGGLVTIAGGCFLSDTRVRNLCKVFAPEAVLMNPPFEGNTHTHFVLRALELAPEVVGVFPSSFEYSVERDRALWSSRATVVRRARLPERVDYGGHASPSFDTVVLKIRRREAPRRPDEQLQVFEEVWRP
jgi:predicted RNA methylase